MGKIEQISLFKISKFLFFKSALLLSDRFWDNILYVREFFWAESLQKTCLYVHEKLQRNPFVGSCLIFFIFQPYGFDYLGFLTNARGVKNSVGLLQGPRRMALDHKKSNSSKSLGTSGFRALLGSVKPRQLMMSDRICCQTEYVVRRSMLADSQYHQTGNVVRKPKLSDSRYGLTIGQYQLCMKF